MTFQRARILSTVFFSALLAVISFHCTTLFTLTGINRQPGNSQATSEYVLLLFIPLELEIRLPIPFSDSAAKVAAIGLYLCLLGILTAGYTLTMVILYRTILKRSRPNVKA